MVEIISFVHSSLWHIHTLQLTVICMLPRLWSHMEASVGEQLSYTNTRMATVQIICCDSRFPDTAPAAHAMKDIFPLSM